LAASAERGSEHPLGAAIVRAAQEQGLKLSEIVDFEAIPGQGVTAEVEGHHVLLGNLRLMQEQRVSLNGLQDKAAQLQGEAKTVMWVAIDHHQRWLERSGRGPQPARLAGGDDDRR
jgi:Cu+-exporting ATPase